MRHNLRILACIGILWTAFLLICVGMVYQLVRVPTTEAAILAGSTVRIDTATGHGSGVHLGGGFFLTAGHVTQGTDTVDILTDQGTTLSGEVLWSNHGYDVSLVYVEEHADISSSPLSCAPNYVGQDITILGNPLSTLFAKSWGKVSSLSKTGLEAIDGDLWRVLVTLDITAAPGVSGGPIFNDRGEVVGILVAGAVSLRGTFRYSYGVPGSAICHVLGRLV